MPKAQVLSETVKPATEPAAVAEIHRLQQAQEQAEQMVTGGIAEVVKNAETRVATVPPPITMAEIATPFGQRDHDLMLKSVDRVAEEWVTQLQHVRKNSEELEAMVLQRAAKLKAELTQLFLLGHAVMNEAKRGDDVNAKLSEEIDKLAVEHA